ncbi:MAG: short-chain dehydrogenase/reductase [Solirubrobacterales bacterium]|jgi:NAD(P)-dependent dehydrogenase (short-subunit alcohol dehydrogenase family)|nr:short-chain dehydrogenase/reductase [Solirubrobacterales bacterium]
MPLAIVTGSDSGIGRATAVALAQAGYDVGITWRSDQVGAQGTADEVRATGRAAHIAHLDLGDPATAAGIIDGLAEELGGLDVLVNNAGGGNAGPVLEIELDDLAQTLNVNVVGSFACAQAAARRMISAGTAGRIINVTSIHEHLPLPGAADYVAAKHALGGLTKSMALELAPHRITVNSVAPGQIATEMTGNDDVDPHTIERPKIPLRRPGDAREVAAMIVALAGPGGGYTTGASLLVDGGMALVGPALAN